MGQTLEIKENGPIPPGGGLVKAKLWPQFRSEVNGSPLVHGVIVAFIAFLILTLIMAGVYTWSNLSEASLPYTAYTINALSSLAGALGAARSAGMRGWYYGFVTAMIFSAVLALVGSLVDFSATFQLETILRILLLGLIGAFGGVIGVNLKRSS